VHSTLPFNITIQHYHSTLPFNITIQHLQAKLHDKVEDHLGQLAAEMHSAREEYSISQLGKRKHEEPPELQKVRLQFLCEHSLYTAANTYTATLHISTQVPSFGILSNGLIYKLYKFDASDANNKRLTHSTRLVLKLDKGITAADAQREAAPILGRLVHMITQQKDAVLAMRDAKKPKI
jgi:hypothetical protein